jgi:hypothetical protein
VAIIYGLAGMATRQSANTSIPLNRSFIYSKSAKCTKTAQRRSEVVQVCVSQSLLDHAHLDKAELRPVVLGGPDGNA